MTWKASTRGSGAGLIGKLAQANIDEVAPVDDEVVVVRDDDPGSAPLRQRLAATTLLRVRELTSADDLGELVESGRVRAVVLCRRGLSLGALHEFARVARARCPEVAMVVLDDQGGPVRDAVALHAGADSLVSLSEDWTVVGAAVLEAAERRARARAIGDALAARSDEELLAPLQDAWPLALLVLRMENLAALAGRYTRGDADTLLLAVGSLVRPLLRPSDAMARCEDDTLLIARRDADELAVAALADRLLRACRHSVPIGAEGVPITVGIGIAIRGSREDDLAPSPQALLESARQVLARGQGRAGYELADPALQARVTAQRQTEVALRHALDNHEFRVFYQPVVDLESGALSSFEALMRWQRPQVGLFDAGSFVEAAQRSGLMTRIGQTILQEAATEAARWAGPDTASPALSVNLSPQEYFMPTLVPSVGRILTEAGLQPDRLTLEVPHRLLDQDPTSARSILRDLASLGVTLVADDYDGELSDELRRLPLRMVKLRMGLLDQIERMSERRAQVAAMVGRVRAAGWLCVGKGVETVTQAAILRDLGCQGGQGFLFSGARPAEELSLFRGAGGVWAWSARARSLPAV
jgi:EAL domain-containing protein (putative c-di-GMP-specific phosphodiesterase class I)/GGDEF domain-containing protein